MTYNQRGSEQKHPAQEVIQLAARQYGVVSRAQALARGMSARSIEYRLARGAWHTRAASIYVVLPGPEWQQALMASCLWGGNGALATHRSAAGLWQLDGVPPGILEIALARSRRPTIDGLVIHVITKLLPSDVCTVGPIPVTSVTRTLLDLGAVAPPDVVEEALDCALRRRLTSIPRLRWRLREAGTQGRKGASLLRDLLEQRLPASRTTDSVLEVRLGRLLRQGDLPPPRLQHEVMDAGRIVARCDFAYPEARLAIEADGYAFHSGRQQWQRDLARRTTLARLGWRVLHVTDDDIRNRPDEVLANVRAALGGEQTTFAL